MKDMSDFAREMLDKYLAVGFEWIAKKGNNSVVLYKGEIKKESEGPCLRYTEEEELPKIMAMELDFLKKGEMLSVRNILMERSTEAEIKFSALGFKKSGFTDRYGTVQLAWEKETEYMSRMKVVFEKGKCFLFDENYLTHRMTPELISAIEAQMKELGWM